MALYHSAKGENTYTIVGTPSIINGVVSGFASNTWLTYPSYSGETINKITFVYKLANFSLDGTTQIIHRSSDAKFIIRISTASNCEVRINTSTIVSHRVTSSQTTLLYVKVEYTTEKVGLYFSADGKNWTLQQEETYSGALSEAFPFAIGANQTNNNQFFTGAIDLNESYIMVNGKPWTGVCPVEVQKHQLMGPVGYTKVGSPTVTDGVASGFSADDYLETSSTLNFNSNMNAEFVVKMNMSELRANNTFLGTNGYFGIYGVVNSAGKYSFGLGSSSSWVSVLAGTSTLAVNTNYWIKLAISNGVMTAYLSEDGSTFTQEGTAQVGNITNRNLAVNFGIGRTSTTLPSNSITSSFDIIKELETLDLFYLNP